MNDLYQFDGPDVNARDRVRLSSQMERVYAILSDHHWHTLPELLAKVGGTQTGISARIRDLRKPRFGGHLVTRVRGEGRDGLWYYKLEKPLDTVTQNEVIFAC